MCCQMAVKSLMSSTIRSHPGFMYYALWANGRKHCICRVAQLPVNEKFHLDVIDFVPRIRTGYQSGLGGGLISGCLAWEDDPPLSPSNGNTEPSSPPTCGPGGEPRTAFPPQVGLYIPGAGHRPVPQGCRAPQTPTGRRGAASQPL